MYWDTTDCWVYRRLIDTSFGSCWVFLFTEIDGLLTKDWQEWYWLCPQLEERSFDGSYLTLSTGHKIETVITARLWTRDENCFLKNNFRKVFIQGSKWLVSWSVRKCIYLQSYHQRSKVNLYVLSSLCCSHFLLVLNSSVNMIIYCILNSAFRSAFIQMIKWVFNQ